MADDVIIALDFPAREETLAFLDRFPAAWSSTMPKGLPSSGR